MWVYNRENILLFGQNLVISKGRGLKVDVQLRTLHTRFRATKNFFMALGSFGKIADVMKEKKSNHNFLIN